MIPLRLFSTVFSSRQHATTFLVLTTVAFLLSATATKSRAAETVEENYDNGQLKLKYDHVDGKKTGVYLEFYEDGEPRLRARYKNDLLEGKYVSYHDNGEPKIATAYKRGKLHGKYVEKDLDGVILLGATFSSGTLHGKRVVFDEGRPVSRQEWTRGELTKLNGHPAHTRARTKIEKSLQKIYSARIKAPGAKTDQLMAVRRLNAYRYLCGLPADVQLDPGQFRLSKAGADVLKELRGIITHFPENPGWPKEKFKPAAEGCARSNLAQNVDSSAESVDLYMFDSDESNIEMVGHRMWCLSRTMATTGFGRNGPYFAMYAHDRRRKSAPAWKTVAFPPAGYVPVDYFTAHRTQGNVPYGWCIALNPKNFQWSEDYEVEVMPLDEELREGEPLSILHKGLADPDEHFSGGGGGGGDHGTRDREAEGGGDSEERGGRSRTSRKRGDGPGKKRKSGMAGYLNWLVFQPEDVETEPGNRYWVRISNIKTSQGKSTTIEYLVEFIESVEGTTIGGPNGDPNEDD